jgi:SAM-dependent methyltransferase
VVTNQSIDLSGCRDEGAMSILDWPEGFILSLRGHLLDIHAGQSPSRSERAALETSGILDAATGKTTRLGEKLLDLVLREEWQKQDSFMKVVCEHVARSARAVLDVGCSTGWMMRSLDLGLPNARVGIDLDAHALALGHRFARIEGLDCSFRYGSAHSLPFPDGQFDLVLCRNALTYTHQRTSLREICRVLSPGGLVFLRFENIWYDFSRISRPGRWRSLCFNTRDFLWGAVLAAVGRQPKPGGRIPGARAFATLGCLTKWLCANGCEVIRSEPHPNSPLFRGHPTQTSLLARKTI